LISWPGGSCWRRDLSGELVRRTGPSPRAHAPGLSNLPHHMWPRAITHPNPWTQFADTPCW
jgi:hypothetical protein